mmetsp:Transcript_80019/g.172951  ORF Transcript_80019/g.172951 Transcript_80019/m.172951 type:complete len:269 (-) Transcript_80019:788-1594(-)
MVSSLLYPSIISVKTITECSASILFFSQTYFCCRKWFSTLLKALSCMSKFTISILRSSNCFFMGLMLPSNSLCVWTILDSYSKFIMVNCSSSLLASCSYWLFSSTILLSVLDFFSIWVLRSAKVIFNSSFIWFSLISSTLGSSIKFSTSNESSSFLPPSSSSFCFSNLFRNSSISSSTLRISFLRDSIVLSMILLFSLNCICMSCLVSYLVLMICSSSHTLLSSSLSTLLDSWSFMLVSIVAISFCRVANSISCRAQSCSSCLPVSLL